MRIHHLSVLAALVGFTACGGGSSPSGPSAASVSTQTVTISSGPDRILIGAVEAFTASATMSDGTTRTVSGTWGTDAPTVATAEASTGRVTGVGSGSVTVFVDYQGHRGTRLIRGLPNFQGAWSGSYAVRSCTQSGQIAAAKLCDAFQPNRVFPTNLSLTQDADRVQGRFFLGTLGGEGSGPIQGDGRLLLSGAIADGSITIDTSWNLESTTAGRVGGGFTLLWRVSGFSGDVRVTADIRDLNRSSNVSSPALARATDGSLRGALEAIAGR